MGVVMSALRQVPTAMKRRAPLVLVVLGFAWLTGWWTLPCLSAVAILAASSQAYLDRSVAQALSDQLYFERFTARVDAAFADVPVVPPATPLREEPVPAPPPLRPAVPPADAVPLPLGVDWHWPTLTRPDWLRWPQRPEFGWTSWAITRIPVPLLPLLVGVVDKSHTTPGLARHASDDVAAKRDDYLGGRHTARAQRHLADGWLPKKSWDATAARFFGDEPAAVAMVGDTDKAA